MSSANNLLKSTLIYTIGNLGSKILTFALVPVYSFCLSRSDLGYYDILLTSVSLLVPFVTVQISDASYRWLLGAKKDAAAQKSAISNGFSIILFNIVAFYLIFFTVHVFYHFHYAIYFSFMFLLNTLYSYLQQVVRGLDESKLYSVSGIVNTASLVLLNLLFLVLFNLNLIGVLLATIISYFISVTFLLYKSKVYLKFSWRYLSRKEIKAMLNYSLPIVPNQISWWLISEANRFIILINLGASFNGIYALSSRFPAIIVIVNSVFMLAWQDHAINSHVEGRDNAFYNKMFAVFSSLELSLVIIMIASSRYLIRFFVGPAFADAWKYMPLLFLAVTFSAFAGFLGVGYMGAKKTKGIFLTSITGSVLNLAISLIFIKKIGLIAPALGTTAGFAAMWLYRIIQVRRYFQIRINFARVIPLLAIAILYMYLITIDNAYLNFGLLLSAVILFFLVNRKLLDYLYNLIRERWLLKYSFAKS